MGLQIKIKRGTRAQLDLAAANGGLHQGEAYLIVDESRVAVGTSNSSYEAMAKEADLETIGNIAGYPVSVTAPVVGDVLSFADGVFSNRRQNDLTDGGNF